MPIGQVTLGGSGVGVLGWGGGGGGEREDGRRGSRIPVRGLYK